VAFSLFLSVLTLPCASFPYSQVADLAAFASDFFLLLYACGLGRLISGVC
jgi:hypothetical protein